MYCMKNTYILVREGENENGPQRWFFSIKDVSDYFERDVKYVSALMTGRIRKGYIVHKGKVNYLKRLPCGEPQYEMQRALEKQLNALKFMKMKHIIATFEFPNLRHTFRSDF